MSEEPLHAAIWELYKDSNLLGTLTSAWVMPAKPTIGDSRLKMGFIKFSAFVPTPAFEEYRGLFDTFHILADDTWWEDEDYWLGLQYYDKQIKPLGFTLVRKSDNHVLKDFTLQLGENVAFISYTQTPEDQLF